MGKETDPAVIQQRAAQAAWTLAQSGRGMPTPEGSLGVFSGWHGSPYLFEPEAGHPLGRFRNEAIGSGEGAQAYGWGHYVAGARGTGEAYRQNLTTAMGASPEELQAYFKPGNIVPSYGGGRDRVVGFNPPDANGRWSVNVQEVNRNGDPVGRLRNHQTPPSEANLAAAGIPRQTRGSLMHLEIKPDEEELLDWDKPFDDQSPGVQKALGTLGITPEKLREQFAGSWRPGSVNPQGNLIYQSIVASHGGHEYAPRLASETLDTAGIPGLKFMDQGSRPLSQKISQLQYQINDGQGKVNPNIIADWQKQLSELQSKVTHNYVIFHPDNIRITGRNGQMLEPVEHDPFSGWTP